MRALSRSYTQSKPHQAPILFSQHKGGGTHHIALERIPVSVAVPPPHGVCHHQAERARLRRATVGCLRRLLLRRAAGCCCCYVAIACMHVGHWVISSNCWSCTATSHACRTARYQGYSMCVFDGEPERECPQQPAACNNMPLASLAHSGI